MLELIHHFLDKFENYGFGGLVIMALIGVFSYLLFDFGKRCNIRFMNRFNKCRHIAPHKSVTFGKLDNMIQYRIGRMRVLCPLRKCIFSKILNIQFTVLKETLMDAATTEVNRMGREEFQNFWINALNKCFSMCEDKCRFIKIPEIALNRFDQINENNEDLIKMVAYQICDSDSIYDTNSEKSVAIIDFVGAIADTFLITAERTISGMNGKLSMASFEGIVCEECRPDCPLRASLQHKIGHLNETVTMESMQEGMIAIDASYPHLSKTTHMEVKRVYGSGNTKS